MKKYSKTVKSFKDDDIIETEIYWIEQKEFEQLLKQQKICINHKSKYSMNKKKKLLN